MFLHSKVRLALSRIASVNRSVSAVLCVTYMVCECECDARCVCTAERKTDR